MARAGDSTDGNKLYITIISALLVLITAGVGLYIRDVGAEARADHQAQQATIDRWANTASSNSARLATLESRYIDGMEEIRRRLTNIERQLNARP